MGENVKRVLVIGATGRQGSGVIDDLERRGHRVVAFVRSMSGAARELERRGMELAMGSLDEPATIRAAAAGTDAVFAMTTPLAGVDTEIRHGRNIADALAADETGHLVFSSVASAHRGTGIGHFDSKWEIEQRISELGIPSTVIAPVFFMDNFLFPFNIETIARGVVRQAIDEHRELQLVDSADIGRTAGVAIDGPDRWIGRRIEIAGDSVTGPQIAKALTAAIGREVAFERQPDAELAAMGDDWVRMYAWLDREGFEVELPVTDLGFDLATFHQWAQRQDWRAVNQAS